MKENTFLKKNIDSAILCSLFDMRGYVHPLGFRTEGIDAKGLSYLPYNLICFSAGSGISEESSKDTITIDAELLFDYHEKNLSDEKVSTLCNKFFSECNTVQKESIQFLLKDVLNKTEELKKEMKSKNEETAYIRPVDKDSNWGKIMLGLMEAFNVKSDEPIVIKTW